jgi:hypothetical protein
MTLTVHDVKCDQINCVRGCAECAKEGGTGRLVCPHQAAASVEAACWSCGAVWGRTWLCVKLMARERACAADGPIHNTRVSGITATNQDHYSGYHSKFQA